MRITIVGAGPVGLLLACLLARHHTVTILDKRTQSTRAHSLSISSETIAVINDYIVNASTDLVQLRDLLIEWSTHPVNTIEIESELSIIAVDLGVIIRRGVEVNSLNDIEDSVIIGADGARSRIRSLVFGDEFVDQHNVQYMVQLKYQTPGGTKPRLPVSAASYSFINGLSGSDMVIDFESLAPISDVLRKPGTLHIPVSETVYNLLTVEGRGTFTNPWTIEELSAMDHHKIAKLVRIINRYEFSLKWRGGWFEDARVTAIPLNIYRAPDVVRLLDNNTLVMLCGDSSSGLVFERGLNKGWLEAVKCAESLMVNYELSQEDRAAELSLSLAQYSQYCITLYESERDKVLIKHNKIVSANKSVSTAGIVLTSGLGVLFGGSIGNSFSNSFNSLSSLK